jgi:hypothetical protein
LSADADPVATAIAIAPPNRPIAAARMLLFTVLHLLQGWLISDLRWSGGALAHSDRIRNVSLELARLLSDGKEDLIWIGNRPRSKASTAPRPECGLREIGEEGSVCAGSARRGRVKRSVTRTQEPQKKVVAGGNVTGGWSGERGEGCARWSTLALAIDHWAERRSGICDWPGYCSYRCECRRRG